MSGVKITAGIIGPDIRETFDHQCIEECHGSLHVSYRGRKSWKEYQIERRLRSLMDDMLAWSENVEDVATDVAQMASDWASEVMAEPPPVPWYKPGL